MEASSAASSRQESQSAADASLSWKRTSAAIRSKSAWRESQMVPYCVLPRSCSQAGRLHTLDRKSTRLNSSHVRISYAVFCLKKKKKNKRSSTYKQKKKQKD